MRTDAPGTVSAHPRRNAFPSFRLVVAVVLALVAADVLIQTRHAGSAPAGRSAKPASSPVAGRDGTNLAQTPQVAIETDSPTDAEVVRMVAGLRLWAKTNPQAAFDWARKRPLELRRTALIAVLEETAAQPELAIRLGRDLLSVDPAVAQDCATALVGALIRTGQFAPALDFIQSGPAESRAEWLTDLFSSWIQREPASARELFVLLGSNRVEGLPLQSLMRSWASVAPVAAGSYALQLPPGAARETALSEILPKWAGADPNDLAAALPRFDNRDEHDRAASALVGCTDTANRPTAVALGWAESIRSPALRHGALQHVLREWSRQDPAAVLRYLEGNPGLTADERESLLSALAPPPPDAS
ncbi:hypothetical protein DB347_06190 [Opitutaceae bacterium EW11]|nr:hypothetical protein DB347_06190 [Opitutaceae bacterium EW11]